MTQLVYLSPVLWSSFSQRPHKFVDWFHETTGAKVLWIDPYPTRFPLPSDFRRLTSQEDLIDNNTRQWLKVIKPFALPIEPLPGSAWLNTFMWRSVFKEVDDFFRLDTTMLAIGKPSVLALSLIKRSKGCITLYDAMDDFPAFYKGLSRGAMRRRECELVRRATRMLVSSTALRQRWHDVRSDIQIVHNGLDSEALPSPKNKTSVSNKKVLGYVGTIGAWFDWAWVIALANARPMDVVRLIGPVFSSSPEVLPANVEILPPCNHQAALSAMQDFDIGLIPFLKNDLTASVDPIKYYEYRALGLPVVSTKFGEMAFRQGEEGVFIGAAYGGVNSLIQQALLYNADHEVTRRFIACNDWRARFDAANIF